MSLVSLPAFQEDKEVLEALLPNMSQLSKAVNVGNAHAENKLTVKNKMIEKGLDVCTHTGQPFLYKATPCLHLWLLPKQFRIIGFIIHESYARFLIRLLRILRGLIVSI